MEEMNDINTICESDQKDLSQRIKKTFNKPKLSYLNSYQINPESNSQVGSSEMMLDKFYTIRKRNMLNIHLNQHKEYDDQPIEPVIEPIIKDKTSHLIEAKKVEFEAVKEQNKIEDMNQEQIEDLMRNIFKEMISMSEQLETTNQATRINYNIN